LDGDVLLFADKRWVGDFSEMAILGPRPSTEATIIARPCPFSAVFVEHGGRAMAIHRTAWNRLDVPDAATGQLATPRQPAAYGKGELHYLGLNG
jgi:hypothetical protein